MKPYLMICLFCVALLPVPLSAQSTFTTGIFNDGANLKFGSLVETIDGNYVLAADLLAWTPGFVIHKFDSAGGLVWSRIIDADSGSFNEVSLAPDPDSGFFLVARKYWNSQTLLLILHLDQNGSEVQPGVNYISSDQLTQIHAFFRSDSTLLVVGRTNTMGIITFTFDLTGNLLQQVSYSIPLAAFEFISSERWGMWLTTGDQLFVTFAIAVGTGNYAPVCISLDNQSQILFARRYQVSSLGFQPRSIVPDANGGYYLLGETDSSFLQPDYDNGLGIMYCTQTGQPQFFHQYFPVDTVNYLNREVYAWKTPSGNLAVLAGNELVPNPYYPDFIIHVAEISASGGMINSGSQGGTQPLTCSYPMDNPAYAFKGAEHDWSQFTVLSNADGTGANQCSGLSSPFTQPVVRPLPLLQSLTISSVSNAVVTPATYSYALTANSSATSDYCLVANFEDSSLAEPLKLFPNPANDVVSIEKSGNHQILIRDCAGRIIIDQNFSNSLSVNTSEWSSGLYIVELRSESGEPNKLQKLIISH